MSIYQKVNINKLKAKINTSIKAHLRRNRQLKNPVLRNFIFLISNLPTKKILGLDDSTGKFYQVFKGKIIQILQKFL